VRISSKKLGPTLARGIAMRRIAVLVLLTIGLVAAAQLRASDERKLDAATMKVALHTATPEEDGFIDYVLAKVDKGTLPRDLVESTFLWAKKKKTRTKFQYFKRGLILRAESAGIKL
jgi:hypothetical protein